MTARYFALFALLVLVIGSGWLLQTKPENDSDPARRALSEGYYLLDATISDTNETGKLVYSLNAQRIDHLPADNSVQLTDLTVQYRGESEDVWTIEAQRGAMNAARDSLNLLGDVTITAVDTTSEQNTTISTDQLTLDIAGNEARTDKQVRIFISGGELSALGMKADLTAKKINLLSNVRGQFGDTP